MKPILRRTLTGLALLGVAGCGFRPLYGRHDKTGASEHLDEVNVDIIPDRQGQLLRQALQQRLEGAGDSRTKRFGLAVVYSLASDPIAIQRDSTSSRVRVTATATWTLRSLQPGQGVLTSGLARMMDGFNIIDQQYFAADMENEDAQRRVAEAIAGQITLQMASYFSKKQLT